MLEHTPTCSQLSHRANMNIRANTHLFKCTRCEAEQLQLRVLAGRDDSWKETFDFRNLIFYIFPSLIKYSVDVEWCIDWKAFIVIQVKRRLQIQAQLQNVRYFTVRWGLWVAVINISILTLLLILLVVTWNHREQLCSSSQVHRAYLVSLSLLFWFLASSSTVLATAKIKKKILCHWVARITTPHGW